MSSFPQHRLIEPTSLFMRLICVVIDTTLCYSKQIGFAGKHLKAPKQVASDLHYEKAW